MNADTGVSRSPDMSNGGFNRNSFHAGKCHALCPPLGRAPAFCSPLKWLAHHGPQAISANQKTKTHPGSRRWVFWVLEIL
jgi:hypothetical protein